MSRHSYASCMPTVLIRSNFEAASGAPERALSTLLTGTQLIPYLCPFDGKAGIHAHF